MTHRTTLWSGAALLGIVLTAVVAWSASQLAGQRIGLASDPLAVANELQLRQAPGRPPLPVKHPQRHHARIHPASRPAPVQVRSAAAGASAAAPGSVASRAARVTPAPAQPGVSSPAPSTASTASASKPTSTSSQGHDDSHRSSGDSSGTSNRRDD